jgi:hypothetical protein
MHRIEVNVETGKQQKIELTAEESAKIQSRPVLAPSVKKLRQARAAAYAAEADPLFFKAQRGEVSMDNWTAAVEAIRARYPYPSEAES